MNVILMFVKFVLDLVYVITVYRCYRYYSVNIYSYLVGLCQGLL